MKSKMWKQFTKYVLPVLALAIAIPLAAACIGTAGKARVLADTPALEMGENAREDFESKYTVDNNYRQLMEIYNTLV